jgi:hypothetical protein
VAFAKAEDVETRLGRSLTAQEESTAEAVIATVTGLIVDCVDRDAEWAKDLDPVPEALKAICVEKVRAEIVNSAGVRSQSETLGAHQRSETFRSSSEAGIFLTPFEERQVMRAVYGKNSGSSTPRSLVDRVIEQAEGRQVDETLTE